MQWKALPTNPPYRGWAQRKQFPLPTFHVFKPDIVTFFEEANLHHPTIKFTIKIHWDNVFRHSYIQRHKIQRKSYPWAYILNLVTHRSVKRVWGNFFKIQKNACGLMMDRGYQHNLKEKLQSEINETHRNRSPRSRNKQRGRKRNVTFCGTIPALSVYCKMKEALMEKWNLIQNQPLLC